MDENIKNKELKGRVKKSIIKLYALIASDPKKSDFDSTIEETLDLLWGYYDELVKREDGSVHITYDPDPHGPITVPLANPLKENVIYTSIGQSDLKGLNVTSSESGENKC